jgi:hypothetical protein
MHQIGDLRAPNLVLAGKAVDIGAGAANPTAGRTAPGSRHMPGQIRAAISTAKDKSFKPFRLSHSYLLSSPKRRAPLPYFWRKMTPSTRRLSK